MKPICCLFIFLSFCPLAIHAQSAEVNGAVSDSSGAVIPKASVEFRNQDTGVRRQTMTNGDGYYHVADIEPGKYDATVQAKGFKTLSRENITFQVGDKSEINFTMQVGQESQTVTVDGSGLQINTTDGSVSTVIDRQFVENLPLNGRSFNTLLELTPGVVIAPSSSVSPGQYSTNGQRTNSNYFMVDGVSADFGTTTSNSLSGSYQSGGGGTQAFNVFGGTSSLVSVDDLQEFQVQTSSFAPEFGHSPGGQVMIETRSGTNDFHGDAFDYFRNTALDANNWFNNAAGLPRTPEHQNDFGGVVGGPIIHKKTFFFFSYEGLRLLQPLTKLTNTASTFARSSAVSAAVPYLNVYPQPNGPVSPTNPYVAQFTGAWDANITSNATSIRIDHALSDKWTAFGRYNYAPSAESTRTGPLSNIETLQVNTQTVTLGLTGVITPHITNSLRANFSSQVGQQVYTLDSFGGATPISLNLVLPSPLSAVSDSASFAVSGLSGFMVGRQSQNQSHQIDVVDGLTLSRGNHNLKFGVDTPVLDSSQSGMPVYLLYHAKSAQVLATTGNANYLYDEVYLPGTVRLSFLSFYAQDTWKVGRKLTVTYGLRWELNPSPTSLDGTALAAWANTSTPATTALAPTGTPLWKTTYGNFAPRIGFAYKVGQRSNLVVRGGWGMFYDLGTGTVPLLAESYPNSGYTYTSGTISLPVTNIQQYAPTLSSTPPYPNGASGFASNLTLPKSYQWNLALEQSLGEHQAFTLTYVGQLGRQLLRQVSEYQPNANFSSGSFFNLTSNGDTSDYNALQAQYRRALVRHLQALVNYTWSHCLDTSSSDSLPLNVLPGENDRGSCDFDVRNNVTAAATYTFPEFTKQRVVGQIINNWSLATNVQARAGFPINVTYYNLTIPTVVAFGNLRPDLVPGVPVWIPGPGEPTGRIMNAAAFDMNTPQAENRQGNLGRNAFTGYRAAQIDVSIVRDFHLFETTSLRFRVDAFNLFNHPNFTNPDPNLSDGSLFGISAQTLNNGLGGLSPLYQIGGPRSLQASLRLAF